MSSRLINVRLDEEHLLKVRALRKEGLVLSDVVRDAIDERFEKLRPCRGAREVRTALQRIFEEHPDPAGLPPRNYEVHDRKAARAAIVKKLRGPRPER